MKTPAEIVLDLMAETPLETAMRREEQAERREAEQSDREECHKDCGMREGDFC